MSYYFYIPDDETAMAWRAMYKFKIASICDMDSLKPGNPHVADYLICPAYFFDFHHIDEAYRCLLDFLPYYKYCPEKHVFFDLTDAETIPDCISNSIVFKVSATIGNGCRSVFYPIPASLRGISPTPISNAKFDVSFIGSTTTHVVRRGVEDGLQSCRKLGLTTKANLHNFYFYDLPVTERTSLVSDYQNTLLDSRFVVCPRGGGLNSHRFFETMAMGRIPILLSDSLKLPLEQTIDWDNIIVRVPEVEVSSIGQYVLEFMLRNEIEVTSKEIRKVWLNYFSHTSIINFLGAALS